MDLQLASPTNDQNTVYQTIPTISIAQPKSKNIVVDFNGGMLTSDAGVLLLQQVDATLRLTERINELIPDPRNQDYITHQQRDLIAQRMFAIALGYEDVNDHDDLGAIPFHSR